LTTLLKAIKKASVIPAPLLLPQEQREYTVPNPTHSVVSPLAAEVSGAKDHINAADQVAGADEAADVVATAVIARNKTRTSANTHRMDLVPAPTLLTVSTVKVRQEKDLLTAQDHEAVMDIVGTMVHEDLDTTAEDEVDVAHGADVEDTEDLLHLVAQEAPADST
jgi:hypothetical protein